VNIGTRRQVVADWWPIAAALVIAASSTVDLGLAASWYDEQRVVALMLLAAFGLLHITLQPVLPRTLIVVLALGFASCLASTRVYVALLDWSVCALVLAIAGFDRGRWTPASGRALGIFALAISASYCVGVVARYVSAVLTASPLGLDTFLVGFANPRFPAQLQALTIPFLPLALRLSPSKAAGFAIGLIAALWWMCLVGSGSRAAWLSLGIAFLVTGFVSCSSRRWLRWHAVMALSGAAAYVFFFLVLPPAFDWPTMMEANRFGPLAAASIDARFDLWKLCLSAVESRPILGSGPMHFAMVNNGLGAHPHNIWLQLAAEWGLPALLLFVAVAFHLVISGLRKVRQHRHEAVDDETAATFAALIVLLVGSSLDGYLVIPTSQLASAVVLATAARVFYHPIRLEPGKDIQRGLSVLIISIAVAVIAMLPLTSFGAPEVREKLWRADHQTDALWPRFWQLGWIGDDDPTFTGL
jgi:putative inorganic carbon (HCO3(-)) transporter